MSKMRIWCVFVCLTISAVQCRLEKKLHRFSKVTELQPDGPSGEPLFLTPYIDSGEVDEGRTKAQVESLAGSIQSYSGFITVNKTYNSNLFFSFFTADQNPEDAPIVLWLQGGPGSTSMYGLFAENGAYQINAQIEVEWRKYYWSKKANVIYIDQPAGTGFSFTEDDRGYATNQDDVGRDLYEFLTQFFKLFPMYQSNPFFVTGESYGGKYIPAISYYIHMNNPTAETKINLKGLAIGDGLVDPINMMVYGDFMYQIGLIDDVVLRDFRKRVKTAKNLMTEEKWSDATDMFFSFTDTYSNLTGSLDVYDYLQRTDNTQDTRLYKLMAKSTVRNAIHVGNFVFHDVGIVYDKLYNDISKSILPWFQVLVENYRVVLYGGQVDVIVAYPLTLNFIQKMKWSGAKEYKNAERKIWYVDGEVAGYTRTAKQFTEILVRDAGHMVPADQPKWAMDLLERLISGTPF